MERCNACGVQVQNAGEFCPLCGDPLVPEPGTPAPACPNEYPDLSGRIASYGFMRRLLLFISLLVCGISVLINLLLTPSFWWCLIVLACTVYCWLSIPPLLRQGVNFANRITLQVIFTSALVIVLDLIIGWRGWSLDFVVPGLSIAGIAAIALMMIFNRTNAAQYILYQVLLGIYGFLPLLLYLLDLSQNIVMVLVPAALGLASLLATIVFGDRTIKAEFKRRFHF